MPDLQVAAAVAQAAAQAASAVQIVSQAASHAVAHVVVQAASQAASEVAPGAVLVQLVQPPKDAPSYWSIIIPAATGFVGVLLGIASGWLKDGWVARGQRKKDAAYLAIIVGSHLMRLAEACRRVAWDVGMEDGEPSGRFGQYDPVEEEPDLELLELEVEWKSLPQDLMDSILRMPDQLATLKRQLELVAEVSQGLRHDDYFDARRLGFVQLGLSAVDKVVQLRKQEKLPALSDDELTVRNGLQRADARLVEEIGEREEERAYPRR